MTELPTRRLCTLHGLSTTMDSMPKPGADRSSRTHGGAVAPLIEDRL